MPRRRVAPYGLKIVSGVQGESVLNCYLRPRWSTSLAGLAIASVLAVTACSSATEGTGSGPATGSVAPTVTDRPATSSSSGAVVVPPPIKVNKTAWFGGETITVGTVTAQASTSDAESLTVHVPVVLENLGGKGRSGFPSSNVDLSDDDTHLDPDNLSSIDVNLPGKTKGKAELDYTIDSGFDLTNAVLTIGTADYQQARIPFGTGTLVDHQPVDVPLTGKITAGPNTLTFTGAQLRADDPDSTNTDAETVAGRLYLVLYFTSASKASYEYIAYDALSAKLPDGTGAAAKDGTNQTSAKQRAYLVIPDPAPAGKYTLTYTRAYDASGNTKGSITLTVPAAAAHAASQS